MAAKPAEYAFVFFFKKGARIILWVPMEYKLLSASSLFSCSTHLDPKPLLQLQKPAILSNNIDKTKIAPYLFFFFNS